MQGTAPRTIDELCAPNAGAGLSRAELCGCGAAKGALSAMWERADGLIFALGGPVGYVL